MSEKSSRKKWIGLVVLSLALAIIIIDTTLLNVSLGTIIRDFNTDIQSIQWVITAYSLTLAALTITGGRLGDLYGRKRMFIIGAITFAVGSFIASISTNVPTMIIGESIIEGIGAALMMPATSSLLVGMFSGRERAIAFGVWGAIAAASSAIGPIVGGFLTTNYSWRWGFRMNIIVVALLCIGSLVIKDSRDRAEKAMLDWVGVALSSFGLFSFVFGIIEASRYGWWTAKEVFSIDSFTIQPWGGLSVVPFSMLIGIVILTGFFYWEQYVVSKGKTPLVSMKIFRNRQFSSGVLTTMVFSLGMAGLIFVVPVFLQSVRNLSAFDTGISLLPMSLTILFVAPLSAILSHKIIPKRMIQTGLLLNACGMLLMYFMINVDATMWTLAPGLMVYGAGMGLIMSQINNLTLSAVSVEQAGEASGVSNTLRQLGSSLGSAVIGSVLLTSLASGLSTGINASQVIPQALKPELSKSIAQQTSNVEFGGGAKFGERLNPTIVTEIVSISHRATVDANKVSLVYAIMFSLLGFAVSFSLPSVRNLEKGESATGH